MDIIVETDIGNDPDDFITLCYLHSAGVNIRCITISPDHGYQVASANLFCKHVGLDIPICVTTKGKYDNSRPTGMHARLRTNYYYEHAGFGKDVIPWVIKNYPDSELFVIGPCSSIGNYLKENSIKIKRATMQGGFLGYHLYQPKIRLPQFENKEHIGTFNLNGDRPGGLAFIDADIADRRFVGKNICHTVVYDKDAHQRMGKPRDLASELFMEAMGVYLQFHDGKKLHDPTAAVCHLHPEIGTWVRGKVRKIKDGWGTELVDDGDSILADVDYDALWRYIQSWS